ncbi:unnamed protein product [Gemmataceae bacterium]|nr:unnamed protein product [Gemmataceae bacterium]VTU00058.1 unnamed protein product [Gemmataceae bacterium]
MTVENFDNTLRVLQLRTPFRVFTVELHGGERFEVDHANALVVRDGVAVFVAPGGVPHLFDHESVNQIIAAGTSRLSEDTTPGAA